MGNVFVNGVEQEPAGQTEGPAAERPRIRRVLDAGYKRIADEIAAEARAALEAYAGGKTNHKRAAALGTLRSLVARLCVCFALADPGFDAVEFRRACFAGTGVAVRPEPGL